jgi:predicted HTH transcriptional regulator
MKKLVIHTPKLAAVRFIGSFDKKLFEVGARKLPILKKEDDNIVIVSELEASMLVRQPHFERADIELLFVNESENTSTEKTQEEIFTQQMHINDSKSVNNIFKWLNEKMPFVFEDKKNKPLMVDDLVIKLFEETLTKRDETGDGCGINEESKTKEDVEETVPFQEDINSLSDEDIIKWCEHFGIKKGNNKIDTLKSTLLPHLPSKEK